ncbi:MAG: FtsX-like permease family protein [Ferruginibacter sp.]|uniref:ABC transporter permease n=1 Tax=Ferruginibacter sp. TaxID=1940288 RepID=UPI002658C82C|nr:ABC transporter permease [Ferruginibacter sp.]MDB5279551.1 FtsX-like permease family protein [Ferruginibacter sp.]
MLQHLFKLIWNKKKQNFLLIIEMLISFIVMFAVFTLVVYFYQNYNRPMGFEYENVWTTRYDNPAGMSDTDSVTEFRASLKQLVKAMPQVAEVAFSNVNTPFSDATIGGGINHGKIQARTNLYSADDAYRDVLGIQLKAGRWFSKDDMGAREKPVVINESLKQELFGNDNPIGKTVNDHDRVVGVVSDMKDEGDFTGRKNAVFSRVDTSNQLWGGVMLIKVKPTADADFEGRLYKALSGAIQNKSIEISHLDKLRTGKNQRLLTGVIIILIVAGFLVVNVALGLFGVLWYNINKRKSEIGLRRAVGASGAAISKQLIGEAMVLATLALIIGTFFAIQFPLMNVFNLATNTYLIALALAITFIYLLVIICALYPGRQAAAIFPAVALHEE